MGKRVFGGLSANESGIAALLTVLIVLFVGSLIITPLLYFMITGTKAGQAHEERTTEFYSADAGVEEAIWALQYGQNGQNGLADNCDIWASYPNYTINYRTSANPLTINGDNVTISIQNENNECKVYRITSIATDTATGKSTTVVSRVTPTQGPPSYLFGDAITSETDVTLGNGGSGSGNGIDIYGSIQTAGKLTIPAKTRIWGDVRCETLDNNGTIYRSATFMYTSGYGVGDVRGATFPNVPAPNLSLSFLDWGEYDARYYEQAVGFYIPSSITNGALGPGLTSVFTPRVTPPPSLGGPAGTNLTLSGGAKGDVVKLQGTIVVTGNLNVDASYKGTLDLNGQTIYVRGNVNIASGSNIAGSGLIISIGAINAQPNFSAGGSSYSAAIVYYNGNATPLTYPNGAWSTIKENETYLLDLNDVWGISNNVNDTIYAVGNNCEVQKYTGPTDNSGTWIEINTGILAKPNLNGVWGTSASNVYAVGSDGHVVSYKGSSPWSDTVVTALDGYSHPNLNGVWGNSSDNVFAVGDAATVMHYNGTIWSPVDVSYLTQNNLYGIWGASDNTMFVVGDSGTILECVGGMWSKFATVTNGHPNTAENLKAVWGTSSSNVFAVGDAGTILHYDGSAWQEMNNGSYVNLRDIWGTSLGGTVFAVGEYGVALKWPGTGSWLKMAMNPLMTRNLNGVWGSAASDVYAVGQTKQNFIFMMSIDSTVNFQPQNNGQFLGSIAGGGNITLGPNQTLIASGDVGVVNFPEYRWMTISTYVINQG